MKSVHRTSIGASRSAILIMLAALVSCVQAQELIGRREQPASGGEIKRSMSDLQTWSERTSDQGGRLSMPERVSRAISVLQASPAMATPVLMSAFTNRKLNVVFRINCAELMRQFRISSPPSYFAALEAMITDGRENPVIRVDAANILLTSNKSLPSEVRSNILDLADSLLREGRDKAHVRLMIMPHFTLDPRAVQIMLSELARDSDLGQTFHVLARLKDRSVVPVIKRAIRDKRGDSRFPITRAHLALGELGGVEAYDFLVKELASEKSETQRHIILEAIGLSRDARARQLLITHLEKPQDFLGAIEGLKFLGDESVVPILKTLVERPDLSKTRKRFTARTIVALETGDSFPDW